MHQLDPIAQLAPCDLEGVVGRLNTGHMVEVGQEPRGEVALEAPQLQQAALPEQRFKGPDHVWVHDLEVEAIGITVSGRISALSVVVPAGRHLAFSLCIPRSKASFPSATRSFSAVSAMIRSASATLSRVATIQLGT